MELVCPHCGQPILLTEAVPAPTPEPAWPPVWLLLVLLAMNLVGCVVVAGYVK